MAPEYFFPMLGMVSPFVDKFFEGYAENIFQSFLNNAWLIILLQIFLGVILSVASSSFAIRKHLKV